MKLKEFDTVLLKDGRHATIVDLPCEDAESMTVDVGCSPKSWDTIVIGRDQIVRLLTQEEAQVMLQAEIAAEKTSEKRK